MKFIKLRVLQESNEFVTEDMQLETGKYELKEFVLLDNESKIIHVSPVQGSDLAQFVEDPLAIEFDVSAGGIGINAQVLRVETGDTPGDFGYDRVSFEVAEQNSLSLDVAVSMAAENPEGMLDFSLQVIAKDTALGTVKWSNTTELTGAAQIQVPSIYEHYTFIVSKPGYLHHTQHFLRSELMNGQSLKFEFLPETLEGFVIQEFENGEIKIYFPSDQNRCKSFARIDVAEAYLIGYTYADRLAVSPTGTPLAGLILAENVSDTKPVLMLNQGERQDRAIRTRCI